ncbi:hypothetical protein AG1IA_00359 [Rhizoctonia solani AG-1 IA]|uniref:Uncharacterized protein n=1 Tax=Thanatephorus cucumeris (strain AG1-IA) TaxID=983506 RepID=L8XA93_THACA|nr:hypothetical protein AG1IA_00359 [Rhizoctonia solani AG-1 IA]
MASGYNISVCLVVWCVLSTCLGGPIIRSLRSWFQDMVDSAEHSMNARDRRRRAGVHEPGEEWEMGRTRRNPMLT